MTRPQLVKLLAEADAKTPGKYKALLKLALTSLPDDFVIKRVKQEAPEILIHQPRTR